MRNVAKRSVVLFALLVAGCAATLQPSPGTPRTQIPPGRPCEGEACAAIRIDVRDHCPPSSKLETVEFRGPRGMRRVRWVIDGPWEFSKSDPHRPPIFFTSKNGGSLPGNRVGPPGFPAAGAMEVSWDRRADGGEFEYVLNLTNSAGAQCTIDPWIVDR